MTRHRKSPLTVLFPHLLMTKKAGPPPAASKVFSKCLLLEAFDKKGRDLYVASVNSPLHRTFMNRIGTPNLLIAVSSQDTQLVHDVLGDEFNLLLCHSYQDAATLMVDDISLAICGVHFDQGRMFDLLQLVRSIPELHDVPFLLALGREVKYSQAILQGIEAAAESLGATAFINILELVSCLGKEDAYEDIRRTVRRLLLLNSLNQSISSQARTSQNDSDGEEPRAA